MSGYVLKPADRDAAFAMDWREGTSRRARRWPPTSAGASAAGTGRDLVVTEQHHDVARSGPLRRRRAGAGLSGRGRVETNAGRTLERAIVLRIALDGPGPD